ncbi:glycine receptor subunit alpha-2-like isoform X2 [Tubulanus polymorphus]|uniref:glycine receptor subunit alpha-2-like isoform X2 n=1 Tax=Tubulanus polymorphus TaxID=672921 RepID=UPI003DA42B8C
MEVKALCRLVFIFLALVLLVSARKRDKKKKDNKDKDTNKETNGNPDDPEKDGKPSKTDIPSFVNEMLQGYDRQQSPHGENATIVQLGIYINSFYSISEQTMDYSVNIYLRQSWNEPRLRFKPFNGEADQMIKLEDGYWNKIWVPDVFFRNEKSASFHYVTIPNRLLRVYSNGNIWYAMKVSVTLSCQMRLQKYPLDTQICPMMLESFGHTMDTVIFKWLEGSVKKEESLQMPQFSLVRVNTIDCSQNYTTGAYPCLQVDFHLKRDIGYFLIQVYIPSILIVILSWVAFWINIEAIPARVSLGLLTVLTMTTQSTGARSSLPRVSYIKAIDVWMSMCLIFVFASLLEFAVVNVFSRKEIKVKRMPDPEMIPMGEGGRLMESRPLFGSRRGSPIFAPEIVWQPRNRHSGDQVNVIVENGRQPRATKSMIPDPKGKEKARRIDKISRKLFPLSFLIFNVVYWVVYLIT